jgi:hypothetical protein
MYLNGYLVRHIRRGATKSSDKTVESIASRKQVQLCLRRAMQDNQADDHIIHTFRTGPENRRGPADGAQCSKGPTRVSSPEDAGFGTGSSRFSLTPLRRP